MAAGAVPHIIHRAPPKRPPPAFKTSIGQPHVVHDIPPTLSQNSHNLLIHIEIMSLEVLW
jgi:hypothetical protein